MAWVNVLHALWIFLPAYVANMSPVLIAKVIPKWNAPIDGGRLGKDGHPLLGPGKTWRGLVGGTVMGGWTAVAVALLAAPGGWDLMLGWDYGYSGYDEVTGIGHSGECYPNGACPSRELPPAPLRGLLVFFFGAAMGFMALVGDAVKSYFKRRRGKDRGAPWVPFDQLDFVVFALAGMAATFWLLPGGWLQEALLGDWVVLATLLLLTPLLHFLVNVLGYALRLKQVPW